MAGLVTNGLSIWSEWDIDVDLQKAEEVEKTGRGPIRGIASSESVDADGEVVVQDGIDWSWFKSHGFLTLEHPLHAMNVIGEPHEIKKIMHNGVPATEVRGELYLEDPVGMSVWKKAVAIRKSGGSRRFGMSIEGKVVERDGNVIKRSEVRSLAISPQPRNQDAWMEPLAASQAGLPMALFQNPMLMQFMGQFSGLQKEILQRAETVGYPNQGQAVAPTGIEALVRQSLQGAPSSSLPSMDEMIVLRLLKKFPYLTWAQGCSAVDEARDKLK